jgi:GMP synthase (glutamine-hydrolysing)
MIQAPAHEDDDRAASAPSGDATGPKKPVLIVVHQIHSNPGHVGHWFRRNGHPLDIRRHFDGDPLPQTLRDHCGAVIFGGPQSANDKIPHIRREVDWVGVALNEEKPFLGICLGAQMLAHHLGARVDHCRHGSVEIGYHELAPTPEGVASGGMPERAFQWHREGFEVPHGARLLARGSEAYPNQAFSYGPAAVGVQFHPEITYTQVNRWSGGNSVRLLLRGAKPRPQHLQDHLVHAPTVHGWLDGFLSRWVCGRLRSI